MSSGLLKLMRRFSLLGFILVVLFSGEALIAGGGHGHVEHPEDMMSWGEIGELVFFMEPTTRWVVLSTTFLGFAAGLIGSFLLLRKRSLMGDALSHAMLPGVPIAFMVMVAFGGTGKWMPGLMLGVTVFGLLGVTTVMAIHHHTRIKMDAAMGIVLSVFFGFGLSLMKVAEKLVGGEKTGLTHYIYGTVATIRFEDCMYIMVVSVIAVLACMLFYKEFKLLCFDENFGRSQGWPTGLLDLLMLMVVTLVTVVGLQTVGIILVIALFVIPAAAARFWTNTLWKMVVLASGIGAFSGWIGSIVSATVERMPAGAIIVIVASVVFLLSMFFGPAKGVLMRTLMKQRLNRQVARQHLLRAFFEKTEVKRVGDEVAIFEAKQTEISFEQLLKARSWNRAALKKMLRVAVGTGLVAELSGDMYRLSVAGFVEAERHVRNHRLWEMYLITHADIAPNHVDRDADMVEHILGEQLVCRLEKLLSEAGVSVPRVGVPMDPHGEVLGS